MKPLVKPLIAAAFFLFAAAAHAEKPPKLPVTFGAWKGPHANTFKGAVRRGISKTCMVVKKDKARVIIEGEVTENGGKFSVRVIVKSPKGDEIVESREYSYNKPNVTQGQADRMGRDVTQIVQRSPEAP